MSSSYAGNVVFAQLVTNPQRSDARGVDLNFDNIVVTGGNEESIRVDKCSGHISSEYIEKRLTTNEPRRATKLATPGSFAGSLRNDGVLLRG